MCFHQKQQSDVVRSTSLSPSKSESQAQFLDKWPISANQDAMVAIFALVRFFTTQFTIVTYRYLSITIFLLAEKCKFKPGSGGTHL